MNKKMGVMAVLAAVFAMVSGVACAALDAGVATLFTSIGTDFSAVAALAWPLFLIIVGGLILFGVVKKVLHKAVG
jgi:hypothetical protein